VADEAHGISVEEPFPEAVWHRRSWNQCAFGFGSRPIGIDLTVGRSDTGFEQPSSAGLEASQLNELTL
jgi:hypothetical protein